MLIAMIVSWIVFGFIVGLIARAILPGTQSMGFLGTTALGVVGSFVGGAVANLLSGESMFTAQPAGWIGSVVGALVVMALFAFTGRRAQA